MKKKAVEDLIDVPFSLTYVYSIYIREYLRCNLK